MAGGAYFRDHHKAPAARCTELLNHARALTKNFDSDGVCNETEAQMRARLSNEGRARTIFRDNQARTPQDDAELAAIQAKTAKILGGQ